MTKAIRVKLSLRVEGATEAELTRGLLAAQAVFDKAEITAWNAAAASFQRDGYLQYLDTDVVTADDWMTAEEDRICDVWDEAEHAAVEACCAGWAVKPESGRLELLSGAEKAPRAAQRAFADAESAELR